MSSYYDYYSSVSNLLLSLNSIIIKDVFEDVHIIKTLITYDIDTVIKTFENFLDNCNEIKVTNIDKSTNIITLNFNNDDEFYVYCYNYSLSRYHYNANDCLFDCNLMYTSYNNNYFIFNHYSFSYDDIYYRRLNKKFCYLVNNFHNIDFLLKKNIKIATTLKNYYINKINYAHKLVLNGWIMDEYFLKEKSWTLNYWSNYVNKFSVIKLKNNVKTKKNTKCIFCKNKFDNHDIVFNINNLYIHHTCLINKLYS